jgi:hypothetical protein
MGIGIGLFYSSVTTAGVTALDPSQSSLAGGILYMFQVAGGAVGLGITTSIFLLGTNRGISSDSASIGVQLTSEEQASVRGVLAGTDSAQAILSQYSGTIASQLEEIVRSAFAMGLRWALLFDAVLALFGLIITATKVAGPFSRFGKDQEAATTNG